MNFNLAPIEKVQTTELKCLLGAQTYPEKENTSLANFLSRAALEALVSTSTMLMCPGRSLTRLLVYVMSVSSVTSTKSFFGGRLHKSSKKINRMAEKQEKHLV